MSGGPVPVTPRDHVVKFYDDDDDFLADVTRFLADGLHADQPALVVATPGHRDDFEAELVAAGVDEDWLREAGRYTCIDAEETLASFMVAGVLDRRRFVDVVGGLLARVGEGGRPVRVFGEMVALLWDEGNVAGAIELEGLWNELAEQHDFTLCCAYPRSLVATNGDLRAVSQVCDQHERVIPPLSYVSDAGRSRSAEGIKGRSQLFVPTPAAARAVRRFVSETLMAWEESGLVDDATLVVSELATNAVRHASSPFLASIEPGDSVVRIAIEDVSPAPAERRDHPPESLGGRGLELVALVSKRWGTESLPDGKVVWAELSRSHELEAAHS